LLGITELNGNTNLMPLSTSRLIWIDLEMTGLYPDTDLIIEIATIVTDLNLNILDEGPVMAIHQSDEVLDGMDEWNTRTHNETGLVKRVKESTISAQEAEKKTLDFLRRYVKKKTSPLCGNTICQDRRFLARYMPKLEAYMHYRNLDVTVLKELADYWYPGMSRGFVKASTHEALSDIRESIAELEFYREKLFIDQPLIPS
jgi:oligoribonuclease